MSQQRPPRGGDRTEPLHVLRLLRIERDTEEVVRLLSRHYGGCFVHWVKGRNRYCPGEEECQNHKVEQTWKGYGLVEVWSQQATVWTPFVLEVTEALELDFRDRWERGQVWKVRRGPDGPKGKKSPVTGRLLEERDPDTFPPEFDFKPVLLSVYHVQAIRLDKKNPLPPRMTVKPSQGAPPVDPSSPHQVTRPTSAEDIQRLREHLKKLGTEPSNGKH